MRRKYIRLIVILSMIMLFSSILILYPKEYPSASSLPPLINYLYPCNYSSIYENFVLLSCSSDSFNSAYCYYLPYIALAWRRIGFEPIVFLVGSEEKFRRKPLLHFLENDFKIKHYFIHVDSSRSISTSQLVRLFGGFLSYENNTEKDTFIVMGDVDLLPITRSRFEVNTTDENYILAVNAFCCEVDKFSYDNYQNIHYYPVSYVGMNKNLWKKIFFPLNNCELSSNITIDMIDCSLSERMDITVPRNVAKRTPNWDIDQRLLSLLIARAEHLYGTYVDKRKLGRRLDPNRKFYRSEFNSIFFFDDVHLPTDHEDIILSDHTWNILSRIFAKLFHNETMQLLSRYHYETAADVFGYNRGNTVPNKDIVGS